MTKYQATKINTINTARAAKGTSQFAQWVRDNYADKIIVSVNAIDVDGNFANEPLKARGYEFSGAGSDHVERGLLAGKKMWFKAFDSEEAADAEWEALVELGI